MMQKEICETRMLQIDKFPQITEATNVHLWKSFTGTIVTMQLR